MSDDKPWTEPGPVHLARRNDLTGRIGAWNTPTEDLRTQCRTGAWPVRVNRTLVLSYITCPACLVWALNNPEAFTRKDSPAAFGPRDVYNR